MKVEIIEGCIFCGACESINSEVFHINDVAHVNQDKVAGNEEDCRNAAAQCPVSVIKIYE